MKKTVNVSAAIILLLAIAVVTMSFGFASYAQNLTINGTADLKKAVWKIDYKDGTETVSTDSVENKATTAFSNDNTSYAFDVDLDEPGDFYETTITVENAGTIDAALKSVNLNIEKTSTADLPTGKTLADYVKVTVTYDGTEYTKTTTGLDVALDAGATATLKIRIEYLDPCKDQVCYYRTNSETTSDVPADTVLLPDDLTIKVSGYLGYTQAD